MPPLPPAGDVLKIELTFEVLTKTFGSRFFISYSGGTPSAGDVTAIATEVASSWNTRFGPLFPTDYTLVGTTVWDLSSSSGAVGVWAGSDAGSRSGTNLPLNIAMCIDFEMARRYRGGKPKIFLPIGNAADQYNETQWTSSFVTSSGTAWSNFVNDIVATTGISVSLGQHVNISYYEGFTVVTSPTTGRSRNVPKLRSSPLVTNISGHTARQLFGTQRRRLKLKT